MSETKRNEDVIDYSRIITLPKTEKLERKHVEGFEVDTEKINQFRGGKYLGEGYKIEYHLNLFDGDDIETQWTAEGDDVEKIQLLYNLFKLYVRRFQAKPNDFKNKVIDFRVYWQFLNFGHYITNEYDFIACNNGVNVFDYSGQINYNWMKRKEN